MQGRDSNIAQPSEARANPKRTTHFSRRLRKFRESVKMLD